MESKPKLHYFKVYARGEPIRLLFSHLKVDYDEYTCPFLHGSEEEKKQWAIEKENYEFKTVPVLEIDGHKLSESRCILRYLAAKYNLAPTDPYDIWRNESLLDHFADIENGFYKAFFSENKKEAFEEFTKNRMVHTLSVLEKRLKENSSQEYFVGDKLTASDVVWVNFYWSYCVNPRYKKEDIEKVEALLGNYPLLKNYIHKRKADFPRLEAREPSII